MRRTLSAIALTLTVGLAAGCGKGASNTTSFITTNSTTTTTTVTTTPAPASLTTVPFVGCAQDGQVGPSPAPSGAPKTAMLDPVSAAKLAFYSVDGANGVLAPRGWNCFGTYGSSGRELYVAPIPLSSAAVFATGFAITGPGIELSGSAGDTSGRFTVAQIIARLFPARMAFARQVIAEGIEVVGLVQEALDGCAANHFIGGGQQDRLTHLMVPGPHADSKAFVTIKIVVAEDEGALHGEVRRMGAQGRLHDHLDRDPRCPIRSFHVAATGLLFKARVHLRRTVALPGPVPSHRFEIDAADHGARAYKMVGH